jgi:hypothetical protein
VGNSTDDLAHNDTLGSWVRPETLLGAFLLVYVAVALAAQARASIQLSIPPSVEGAPIEAFTSGLLWILAMYGLLRATEAVNDGKRLVFWLLVTAAFGALAVDEIVGLHESTEPAFNDDWVKVVMWLATPILLYYIAQIETAPRGSIVAMVAGFSLQTAYLLVEIGDGEVFMLPASVDVLKWSEEVFELLFLAAYTYALWILILRQRSTR